MCGPSRSGGVTFLIYSLCRPDLFLTLPFLWVFSVENVAREGAKYSLHKSLLIKHTN